MNSEIHLDKNLSKYETKLQTNSISDYIKNRLSYYKKNHFEDNFFTLTKTLNKNSNMPIELTIRSINIMFKKANQDSNSYLNEYDFYLPFEFLPIFYSLRFNSLIKFLAFYLKINFEEQSNEITFNKNEFNYMMNNFSEFNFEKDHVMLTVDHKKLYKLSWLTSNNMYDVIIKYMDV